MPRTRVMRSNCQHPLDHRKIKRIPKPVLQIVVRFDKVRYTELWHL